MATTTRSSMRVKPDRFMIPKSYTKFLDAHMTQCELDSASSFGVLG